MIIPPYLKKGQTIAITCPSGYLEPAKTDAAIATFKAWGLKVWEGETLSYPSQNYFSAPDTLRLEELQNLLDNPDIHAIMMGRGGYGMSRLIEQLDFRKFKKDPKWICGFSDITLLHSHLQQKIGVASLHSPMCAGFIEKENFNPELIKKIMHQTLLGKTTTTMPITPHSMNRMGSCEGIVVGGNLAMVTHAIGSSSQLKTKGCILFLEDIGEHLYKIDRMMIQLKRAGMLEHLAGIIFGYFSDVEDTTRPFGEELETILLEHIKDYSYPIGFNFPIGHEDLNFPIKMGVKHSLKITKNKVVFKEL